MGFVVFHIQKGISGDGKMTSHIERESHPKNADATRTHLNKELIDFPEGVTNRTEAIQYRLKNAGLKRKIGKNQVQALRIVLSASPEDMERIKKSGKLEEWCKDGMGYLKKEFGEENVVSVVLHDDEQTPHLHATVVPIVVGERRKVKNRQLIDYPTKKKYKKKDTNAPRLCADDVMARDKLVYYQDSYAEEMAKYGLERGVKGSEARHIDTQQYYRDLFLENKDLEESIESKNYRIEDAEKKVYDIYEHRDKVKEEFMEIHNHLEVKNRELSDTETRLEKAKGNLAPYKAQDELNQIHELLPMVKEQLRIADQCKTIGFTVEHIKAMLRGVTFTINSAKLYSPEHKQKIEVKDSKIKIDKEPDDSNKLRLNINGVNIVEWFRERYKVLKEKVRSQIQPNINRGKGIRR